MSRLVHIERQFSARLDAERWFHRLKPTAWPYIRCIEVPEHPQWRVAALVEQRRLGVRDDA